ncbi:MAG: 6-phosphogluconolactonase [Sphaerochaetaceae bacterium]
MKKIRVKNPAEFGSIVAAQIKKVGALSGNKIRIGVPGGRGSVPVIEGILECDRELLDRVVLYLVDERLEGETNRQTLMNVGLQKAIDEKRFSESSLIIPNLEGKFFDFEGSLDLVYLGVGEDGHIASLFPNSYPALDSKEADMVSLIEESPKPPNKRLTVSYRGFRKYAQKSSIYLLFFGEGKRAAYNRFLKQKESPSTLPSLFFTRELFNVTVVTDLEEA